MGVRDECSCLSSSQSVSVIVEGFNGASIAPSRLLEVASLHHCLQGYDWQQRVTPRRLIILIKNTFVWRLNPCA